MVVDDDNLIEEKYDQNEGNLKQFDNDNQQDDEVILEQNQENAEVVFDAEQQKMFHPYNEEHHSIENALQGEEQFSEKTGKSR